MILVLLPVVLITTALALGLSGGAQSVRVSTSLPTNAPSAQTGDAVRGRIGTTEAATAPAATAVPVVAAVTPPGAVVVVPATVPKPVVAIAASEPSVATLIAEVEAAGMEPGSNWTWTMGDTATHCGVITGAGTGCTYGADGLEYSIFAGSPTLALVAHELANAETQNDAVPNLLNEVAAAEDGTSWSPTDAVATCLVEHFMGVQDNSAGTWQCPAALATVVANNIHDTI
jgi:hypothetical protein